MKKEIDNIEVGDWVNGLEVTSVRKTVDGNVLIGLDDVFGFSKFDNDYKINSIVKKGDICEERNRRDN